MKQPDMMNLYHDTCRECSALITRRYSTSFSMGIRMFSRRFRGPVTSVYGFVRFADEIVDSFHGYDKAVLLQRFRADTFRAIDEGISLNPVLHTFQQVVHLYGIDRAHIEAFLDSMEMDLDLTSCTEESYNRYIYGSAEVVGLMCLRVFCEGDRAQYDRLEGHARSLGAAFQKINFLRDIQADYEERGRVYFPGLDYLQFDDTQKKAIEANIARDFEDGRRGIAQLPEGVRLGVHLAYVYYTKLFDRIRKTHAHTVKGKRIRVPDSSKMLLLARAAVRHQFNLL
jgi:15-cis-phytoene synthase